MLCYEIFKHMEIMATSSIVKNENELETRIREKEKR